MENKAEIMYGPKHKWNATSVVNISERMTVSVVWQCMECGLIEERKYNYGMRPDDYYCQSARQ